MRIALVQMNAVVGDIPGNEALVRARLQEAREAGAQLVLFPELALSGYPPEDLLLKEHFLAAVREATLDVAREAEGIVALVGTPERVEDVYNGLAVMTDGAVQAIYRKNWLPNYGVFDEQRYFQAGDEGAVFDLEGVRIGLTVCEDIWVPGRPESDEATAGAPLIVNAPAPPCFAGKGRQGEAVVIQRGRNNLSAFAFCNRVGGQDELIFDGHSLLVDHEGVVMARAPQFAGGAGAAPGHPQSALPARLRETRLRPPAPNALPEVRQIGRFERPERKAVHELGGE